ncbi:hypothetical protein FDECE_2897 [Fusarium decemcellulare]|nr:hypothetical protein FDECE_2897 [Fusarium decemcellulare]
MSLPSLTEWLIQVPVIPGSFEKRVSLRQQHFNEAMPKIRDGIITFAGGVLSEPTLDGDNKGMTMTIITVNAENEAEARKVVEEDVYSSQGVWDIGKMQIFAFKTGIRVPK